MRKGQTQGLGVGSESVSGEGVIFGSEGDFFKCREVEFDGESGSQDGILWVDH